MSIFNELVDVFVPRFRIINNEFLEEIKLLKLNKYNNFEDNQFYTTKQMADEDYLKEVNSIKKEYQKSYASEINKAKKIKFAGAIGLGVAGATVISVPIVTSSLLISELAKKK